MRKIEYISPSSIGVFEHDLEEYYMRYLADDRPPRMLQTQPMSIGSAFDAYVKNFIHEALFGKGNDPRYALDAIFEAQVEPHHRDWARQHGAYVFSQYQQAGCLADLMLDLRRAQGEPRFEFDLKGAVHGYREGIESTISNVTFMGKPDAHFINHEGTTVILDFKVNGYCSTKAQSPMAGYINLRSAGRSAAGAHKDCQPMMHNGMMINIARYLEESSKDWARQLSIYAWLTGCAVGSDFLVGIDQLSCSPNPGGLPSIRIAQHRTRCSNAFQWKTFNRAAEIWEVVHSEHLFRNMSKAQSKSHCASLDRRAKELGGAGADHDVWFSNATRVNNGSHW